MAIAGLAGSVERLEAFCRHLFSEGGLWSDAARPTSVCHPPKPSSRAVFHLPKGQRSGARTFFEIGREGAAFGPTDVCRSRTLLPAQGQRRGGTISGRGHWWTAFGPRNDCPTPSPFRCGPDSPCSPAGTVLPTSNPIRHWSPASCRASGLKNSADVEPLSGLASKTMLNSQKLYANLGTFNGGGRCYTASKDAGRSVPPPPYSRAAVQNLPRGRAARAALESPSGPVSECRKAYGGLPAHPQRSASIRVPQGQPSSVDHLPETSQ